MIPSDAEIRALHREHAPTREMFELVYGHCEVVRGIAEQLLPHAGRELDADLVRAGSLLHDIGVYRLGEAPYVRHGVLGHELLAEEGLPEELCRFASHHTGVGLTADDVRRQSLPLPVADYLAETGEEELVMYADKFHTKSHPPRFVSAESYAAHVRRYGDDKVAIFEAMCGKFGLPDLGNGSS